MLTVVGLLVLLYATHGGGSVDVTLEHHSALAAAWDFAPRHGLDGRNGSKLCILDICFASWKVGRVDRQDVMHWMRLGGSVQ